MKVLVLASWYPTKNAQTSGVFFRQQAQLLINNGHEVKVLVPVIKLVGRKKYIQNLGRTKLSLDKSICLQDPEAIYMNIEYYSWNENELYDTVFLKDVIKLVKTEILKDWDVDIIHAHDALFAGLLAHHLNKHLSIPYVLTQHTPLVYGKLSQTEVKAFKMACSNADVFSVVSMYERVVYIRNEFVKDATIIGNLVPENLFFPLPVKKKDYRIFKILNLGSYSLRKDYYTLFKSIHNFITNNTFPVELDLVIVTGFSDGINHDVLLEWIKEFHLENIVKFHFNITDMDILRSLYQSADVYISTSIYETFGVAVAEAISCGTPVIAVDNGGVWDIIDDSENGFIVPLKDSDAIANYLSSIQAGKYAFNSRSMHEGIKEKFGNAAFSSKLLSAYKNAIDKAQKLTYDKRY